MKKVEELSLNNAYQTFVKLILSEGSIDQLDDYATKDVMGYGTTIDEIIHDLTGLKNQTRLQREQTEGPNFHYNETPVFRKVLNNDRTAIFVDEIELNFLFDGKPLMFAIRLSTIMEHINGKWKAVHFHASKPEYDSGGSDPWHKEEWEQKNKELQNLVDEKTLDLEHKNRELEIEAALERVRAVAMSMYKPDDLMEVCQIISEQLESLKVKNIRNVQVAIIDEPNKSYANYQYFAAYREKVFEETGYENNPASRSLVREMQKSTNSFFIGSIKDDELKEFKAWRVKYKQFPDPVLDKLTEVFYYFYSIGEGGLGLTTYKTISENELEIFKRFHLVFKLAYRRFIDIQRAEAQAHEARIEASLEKIRSASMAMHQSEELQNVVEVMYDQVVPLGLSEVGISVMLFHPETSSIEYWFADHMNFDHVTSYFIEGRSNNIVKQLWNYWANQEVGLTIHLENEEKREWDRYLFAETGFKKLPPELKKDIESSNSVWFSYASMRFGLLEAVDVKPPKEENVKILHRVAKVFDQTYTRFLDLQKAEAQAREAKIEASLERIRSQAMAMQHSDDLVKSTAILFEEFEKLKLSFDRCGIGIFDKETRDCHLWTTVTNHDGKTELATGITSLTVHPMLVQTFEAWEHQRSLQYILEGKELEDYYALVSKSAFHLPSDVIENSASLPKEYYMYTPFGAGGLYVFSAIEPAKEEKNIIRRFAEVFHLTYTRYEDLQKAEARALEAVKQASLDRVRGQIASMRTTKDLEQITPLIWNELKTLEVPFTRCGVFIVDEKHKHVNVYLTTPDGKALGALDLKFSANDLTEKAVASWRKKEVYRQHWNQDEFMEWTSEMMKLRQIKVPTDYLGAELPPESLNLHFIPFDQGMLYVGNSSQLMDEQIDLVKSLAGAFSFAYSRYQDFVVLEEAKQRVEKALNDLKATQSQLVHAEKMASLGELTAGIAHEIQNPLNFVNNFAEVSTDIIDELNEEIDNNDMDEVKAIARDLRQNLEKIGHHGQRASSIVKGMLEHSRTGSGEKLPTDINALADEYLRLAYHGLRAKDKSFNADFKTDFDDSLPKAEVIPQDIGRVLLNLINNAFYAVHEKNLTGLKEKFKPTVTITTKNLGDNIEIRVQDNGNGIPDEIKEKIFQPFFTTKPTGQGTGLGLSMSYDIITKGHGGKLSVESSDAGRTGNTGQGTEFIITLPLKPEKSTV